MADEKQNVLEQLADILRGQGWKVEPPGQQKSRLYEKPAAELDMSMRTYNCLSLVYSEGRHAALTQKRFRKERANGNLLSVAELAQDFSNRPEIFGKQRNLGPKTMQEIEEVLESEGVL